MKPYYERGGITIYHADCRDVLPSLGGVDLLLSDPPYGIDNDCDYTRFSGGLSQSSDFGTGLIGDSEPFDPSHLLAYPKVILWGANHYASTLPRGTWLVWLKKRDNQMGAFLSDCEIAWQKGGRGVYATRLVWHGFDREAEKGKTLHPTQKPIGLMRWCIERAQLAADSLVIDPYSGAGATLLAARDMGHRAIGIELLERWAEVAANRLMQDVLPLAVGADQ